MTDNPFSAPVSEPSREPAPRRDPLATLSDAELKKYIQYYRDRSAWCAYLGLLGFVNLLFATFGKGEIVFQVLFLMMGSWFAVTVVLIQMRHLVGRIMAFITFGLMALIALLIILMGQIPGVVGLALGLAGIKHVYDTKAIYDGTLPTHKALKEEKKRRRKRARR